MYFTENKSVALPVPAPGVRIEQHPLTRLPLIVLRGRFSARHPAIQKEMDSAVPEVGLIERTSRTLVFRSRCPVIVTARAAYRSPRP